MSDAREQPAAQPQKKRMSRGTRVLVIIVCVLLAIALILVATVLILSAVGRNALTNDDGVNIARDDVEALGSGTVRYNGQLYRYNTDIVTILLMGVDRRSSRMPTASMETQTSRMRISLRCSTCVTRS